MTVSIGLLLLVVGSLLTVFASVQRSATFVQARSETLDGMRLAVDRMTKEIRQATSINEASTASRLEMDTYVLGTSRHIVYEATGTQITRSVDGGSSTVLQGELATSSVFTYTPSTSDVKVVTVTLSVRPVRRPDTTLVLTSEARLRNRSEA